MLKSRLIISLDVMLSTPIDLFLVDVIKIKQFMYFFVNNK